MSQRLLLGLLFIALLIASVAMRTAVGVAPQAKQPAEGEAAASEEPSEAEPAEGEAETTVVEAATEEPAAEESIDPLAEVVAAEAAQARFDETYSRWRELLLEMASIRQQYFAADEAELPALQEQFAADIEKGHALLQELREAGIDAYRTAPNENRQITNFLYQLLLDDMERSNFEQAAPLAQLLIDNEYDNKAIYGLAGTAYFVLHDYDNAQEYLEQADQLGQLSELGHDYLLRIDEARELWAEELAHREADAEADDLPRVRIETTEGDIVVELFEDEAPDTVGNFVHLVEQGTYDDTTFHRVIDGFMAQGGDPNGDGTGGPGYRIYDEHMEENARNHFRGSLSMANTGQPNSGGSQFFLCFTPTFELNGRHTVFGRVIEGMDVLARIQRFDPQTEQGKPVELTRITGAEVLRKRDHEYVPSPVEDQ